MISDKTIDCYKVSFLVKESFCYQYYKVTDPKEKRLLLKLINPAKLNDLQFEPDGFSVTELEVVKNISHANILKAGASGKTVIGGQRFLYTISDFVPGEFLSDKLGREKYCSIYEAKLVARGILNALKYLHSLNEPIIVNNICPDSIFLGLEGSAPVSYIADFGFARKLDKDVRKVCTNGISPFCLAPEMFKGIYSTRTDLYAVGALMYEMVFGMQPWQIDVDDMTEKDKVAAILSARKSPLPIPDVKILEMDDNFLSILAKSLNQDIDNRFQCAEEFLMALEGEQDVEPGGYKKISVSSNEEKKEEKMPKKKGNGFADVAGMESLKKRLQEEVIDLVRNPERYRKLKVKIPNGILLYGPPGCGKTFIAEKFAEELESNYIYAHCSDIASPYIHGGQEKIAALFKQARENAPTVLFLDELDAMIANRSLHNTVSESGEVNEFLTQLNNCAEDGVLVVGATNNPSMLDPAALRSGRLDIKVYVPAPSEEEREALLRLSLKDIAGSDIDYKRLAEITAGYVSKDICVLVNKAALLSAKDGLDAVPMASLLKAIDNSKGELPSVSEKTLNSYLQIRDEFESHAPQRNPVGFRFKED